MEKSNPPYYIRNQKITPKIFDYCNTGTDVEKILNDIGNDVIIVKNVYESNARKQIYEICEKRNLYHKGFLDLKIPYNETSVYKCYVYDDETDKRCNYKAPVWDWDYWDTIELCEKYNKKCNHQYCQGLKCPKCLHCYDSGDLETENMIPENNCVLISRTRVDNPEGCKNKSTKVNRKRQNAYGTKKERILRVE